MTSSVLSPDRMMKDGPPDGFAVCHRAAAEVEQRDDVAEWMLY